MKRRRGGVAVELATAGDLALLFSALEDAAEYRRNRAAEWCDDCEADPFGACAVHVADLQTASAYDELAASVRERKL